MSFRTLIIFEAIIIKIHNFYDEVNWVIIAVFETKQEKSHFGRHSNYRESHTNEMPFFPSSFPKTELGHQSSIGLRVSNGKRLMIIM